MNKVFCLDPCRLVAETLNLEHISNMNWGSLRSRFRQLSGLMAAKLLVEAAGTRASAIIVAYRVSRQVSAREARRVLGMDPLA
jgi:hypothetical protein